MTRRIRRQRHRRRGSKDIWDTEGAIPGAEVQGDPRAQDEMSGPPREDLLLTTVEPAEAGDQDRDPDREQDPDHPEAFGRWLRGQRELRGISLRAIADSSRIGMGYLQALESGRFEILPAEVFTKGFLRQYSGFVGLDPEEAINFYLAARNHLEEDEDPLRAEPAPQDASAARWVLVALALAGLLLGVIWGLSQLAAEPTGQNNTSDPTTTAASSPSSSTAAAATSGGTPTEPAPTEGSSEVATGGEPHAAGETPTVSNRAPGPDAPEMPLRVVLDFSDTCWVSALIDGGEIREKVHAQGESLTLSARESVEVKVGNYRAVEVEVNGMPYDLGSRGRSGSVVRTVVIDLATVRALRGSGFDPTTGEATRSGAAD